MNLDRSYPEIVRDLLTLLTGGEVALVHHLTGAAPDELRPFSTPVRRVSHLQGEIELGGARIPYRFTERDFEVVGTPQRPEEKVIIRFRPRRPRPAADSDLIINFYPFRTPPPPLTDINVGSVVRTLLETVGRELATQHQQLKLVYESGFVETAKGSSLDKVVALVDVRRIKQGHAVGKVRFSRRPGSAGEVFLPTSTVVTDGKGVRYLTSEEATLLPRQGSVEIWVHGETPETPVAEKGKLVVLERAIEGVAQVANEADMFRAAEAESDEQLAQRARRAVHAAGRGTLDALRFGLESFSFVTGVTVVERPGGVPGTVRIDVAMSEQTPDTMAQVRRRIDSLRPAGVEVQWQAAEPIEVAIAIDHLLLAGGARPAAEVRRLQGELTDKLAAAVEGLVPGGTLRKAQLSALLLGGGEVIEAPLALTAAGATLGDSWAVPAGRSVVLRRPVLFGATSFADQPTAGEGSRVSADAELVVTLLGAADRAAVEEAIKQRLAALFQDRAPADISFDELAAAVRDDASFALRRAASVFSFEADDGRFDEVREGEATRPVGPVTVRRVLVQAVEEEGG